MGPNIKNLGRDQCWIRTCAQPVHNVPNNIYCKYIVHILYVRRIYNVQHNICSTHVIQHYISRKGVQEKLKDFAPNLVGSKTFAFYWIQNAFILYQSIKCQSFFVVKKNFHTDLPFDVDAVELPINYNKPIYGKDGETFLDFVAPGIMCSIIYFLAVGLTSLTIVLERKVRTTFYLEITLDLYFYGNGNSLPQVGGGVMSVSCQCNVSVLSGHCQCVVSAIHRCYTDNAKVCVASMTEILLQYLLDVTKLS